MKNKFTILGFILVFLSAAVLSEFLVNSQNILYKNDFWIPYRVSTFGMRGQAIESILDRRMIANEKLNEHHLRVFSKQDYSPARIDYKFRLFESSWVDVIYNVDEESYEAVRISSEKWRPSYQYKSLHTGKYLWKKPIALTPETGRTLEGSLRSENGKLAYFLNGQKINLESQLRPGKVGFDLSSPAQVWSPLIFDTDGKVTDAPFKISDRWYHYFIPHLVLLLVIGFFFRKRFFEYSLFMVLFFTMISLYDHYYYSRKKFRFSLHDFSFINRDFVRVDVEKFRYNFMQKWYRALGGYQPQAAELQEKNLWPLPPFTLRHCREEKCTTFFEPEYPQFSPRKKNSLRIVVFGGSLSAGQGLRTMDESYPDLMYFDLKKQFPDKDIELVNASKNAREIDLNIQSIDRDIKSFKPDILILDALLDMSNPQGYEPFIKFITDHVPVVIMLRLPLSYEHHYRTDLVKFRNKIARGLERTPGIFYARNDHLYLMWIEKYGIKFIDTNPELLQDEVLFSGDLFWDSMHLTVYGHQLWTSFLDQKLISIIKENNQILK